MKRLLSVPLILLTALLFAPLLNSAGVSSYSRGVALLLLGEREQAKPFLEQGLKGANLRGLIPAYQALAEGREMDAASLFERAVRQRIKGMEALIGYGQAMGEYSLYYREYYFRFAGELFPKSGAAQLCQGAFLVQQGDPAKGILFVQKALKLERVPEYRLFLALAYRYLNQEAKEREELVGALKEGALSFSALQRAAELFEREGKNQQAVALVREQGERFSSRPLYRVLLAGVLRRGGDYRGALEELGRVTGPSLQEFPFLKEKALALLEKRDRVEALKFFRQAEAMGEEDREFSLRYGEALMKSNAAEAGRWFFRAVLLGDPKGESSLASTPRGEEWTGKLKGSRRIPFFQVEGARWWDDTQLLVWGKGKATPTSSLYLVDALNGKILQSHPLDERVQSVLLLKERGGALISTLSKRKDEANLFLFTPSRKELRLLTPRGLPAKGWTALLSPGEKRAYLLEETFYKGLFRSPFRFEGEMGKLFPYFPNLLANGYVVSLERPGLPAKTGKGNIDLSLPFYKEYKRMIDLYASSKIFREAIERSGSFTLLSGEKSGIETGPDYILLWEVTPKESWKYTLFTSGGETFQGSYSSLLKKTGFELVDFLGLSLPGGYLVVKGEGELVQIDFRKNRVRNRVSDLFTTVASGGDVFYSCGKDLRAYRIDRESGEPRRLSKLDKFTQILSLEDGSVLLVNGGLWLTRSREGREEWASLFPKTKVRELSPTGARMAFVGEDGAVVTTPLR